VFATFNFIKFNCNKDTIYNSAALSICVHLLQRFKSDVEIHTFMLDFLKNTIASIASMEAALIEAAQSNVISTSFTITKAREVHINLCTDSIAKFIQLVENFRDAIQMILNNVLQEFVLLFNQSPPSLIYLLQVLNQISSSTVQAHFLRNKPYIKLEFSPQENIQPKHDNGIEDQDFKDSARSDNKDL